MRNWSVSSSYFEACNCDPICPCRKQGGRALTGRRTPMFRRGPMTGVPMTHPTTIRATTLALALLLVPAASAAPQASRATYDPSLFSGLRYRMIGPMRGGRVTAVTGVPSQPQTFYMGSTGGGIWKTTDAGRTWAFIGLRDVGQIATIRVHPTNPNLVFVAALGNPFAPNVERGVSRPPDGGRTWRKVLSLSDSTGAADLELQPGSPNVVFASMWRGQRKPWTIISGAREGGLYKSTDGGDTWTKLGGGLPNDLFGRSNVAIPAVMPNRVYALVEAKPGGGLYRSEDAGATWSLVNDAPNLWTRPFYYTTLWADPNSAEVVYVGNEGWYRSADGGKSFRTSPVPHGDNHEMWINPRNSDYT